MKDIMARESSDKTQIVPSFGFNPDDKLGIQGSLFANDPIKDLADDLIKFFKGRSLSFRELFDEHNVGTHFIEANYKAAIIRLEEENKITTVPPAQNRIRSGKITCGDSVQIIFPGEN